MKRSGHRLVVPITVMILLQLLIPCSPVLAREQGAQQDPGAIALTDAKAGEAYSYNLDIQGGIGPFNWRVVGGEMPPGLTLDRTGKIKGLPTTARLQPYLFTIELSDSSQPPQRSTQAFLIRVNAAPLRMVVGSNNLKIVAPRQQTPNEPEHAQNNDILVSVSNSGSRMRDSNTETTQARTDITWPYMRPATNGTDSNQDKDTAGETKTLPIREGNELNPARFVKVYEVPKARSAKYRDEDKITNYGESASRYGKLIYDWNKPGLNNTKLTADENSTIVVVPAINGRDIAFNTIYMSAKKASGDTEQDLEVENYSELKETPSEGAQNIGADFESAENILKKLITIQRRTTDILKETLQYYKTGEIPADELMLLKNPTPDHLRRARRFLGQFGPEIEDAIDYILRETNRDIVERVANNVFNVDRDSLVVIVRQLRTDLSVIAGPDTPARDEATVRLLNRTMHVYEDFRGSRAQVYVMSVDYDRYTPPVFLSDDGTEPARRMQMIQELKNLQRRIPIVSSEASQETDPDRKKILDNLVLGLRKDAADKARDIYAFDESSEAIAAMRATKFPDGRIFLEDAKAKDGDKVNIKVQVQNPAGKGTGNSVTFEIAVKQYGIKLHWASSFMFLKRLDLNPEDLQPAADGTTLTDVNFAPSPGMSYGITFFKRGDRLGDKILRALAPTIGINVSFMNFDDPGFDLATGMFTNTAGTDVQVGAGPVFSLFNNKLHFTQGWNLNADRKRKYFGIGFGFIEIAKEVSKVISNATP